MATFELICPHCNNKLNIAEEFIGEEVICRYCLKKLMPTRSSDVNASAKSIKEPQSMQNKENKMETFEVTCPHCNNTLNVSEEFNGKIITCKHCLKKLCPFNASSKSFNKSPTNFVTIDFSCQNFTNAKTTKNENTTNNTAEKAQKTSNVVLDVITFPIWGPLWLLLKGISYWQKNGEPVAITFVILVGLVCLFSCYNSSSKGMNEQASSRIQSNMENKTIVLKDKERIKQEAIERTKQDLYAKGRKVQTANQSMDTANSLSNVRVNIHPQRDTGGCTVFVYGDVSALGEIHQIRWCYYIAEDGEWVTVSTYMGPK